ncbi:AAA family ATPase [Cytophagales bacterium LB-30]|uniref:AAA family ATPase n=1 Tax=Shiella aurantiaca TaxID=3058365 RepID=A0ABT8F923_9BACT|nr:AAA family ATPase [Shiella aurantiaca]MDN4166461.1 AAA family ATPase [Shiella aurantiaca]
MLLKTISLNHHKLFGSTKINLFGENEPLTIDLTREHHTDILLEIDNKNEDNFFTFIIGQNGVGKTILFRTIVNFINANGPYEEPKLKSIINFYRKSSKYIKYNTDGAGIYELQELDIYNYFSIIKNTDLKDFLKYYNANLVFISSSFERSIVHRNPRYRNFNYISDINKTQTLFLKSLFKFNKSKDKLQILTELLEKKSVKWNLQGYLSVDGVGGIENDSIFLLKNNNRVNIVNFLRTIKKVNVSENETLITEDLDENELRVFEAIYFSSVFYKFYFDSNLSFKDLFQKIRDSKVLRKIEDFILEKTNDPDLERHLNIRVPKTEKNNWEFLFTEINDLSEFDVNTLLLLEDLNLINLTVLCNDVPVSYMSSGEQSIIRLFSYFADVPSTENLLIFFDEPENTLHPKWQQNFPIYFRKIVEDIYEIKKSHFIFSTHSPIVIMKSTSLNNSNVVRFYKDSQEKFKSQQITNINSYSIEEVLLDEFKISYRSQEIELNVNKMLSDRNDKILENNDPIFSVEKSFELKDKINELFKSLKTE